MVQGQVIDLKFLARSFHAISQLFSLPRPTFEEKKIPCSASSTKVSFQSHWEGEGLSAYLFAVFANNDNTMYKLMLIIPFLENISQKLFFFLHF